jgi:predicted nucleic acid-binding protein
MIAVLDVSAAIQVLHHKEKADKFRIEMQNATYILAPALYTAELSNTMWKYYHSGDVSKEECLQYINDGLHFIDRFCDMNTMWKEAVGEGINQEHSIYDMFYAILARKRKGILLTNDGKLTKVCDALGVKYIF